MESIRDRTGIGDPPSVPEQTDPAANNRVRVSFPARRVVVRLSERINDPK